MDDIPDLFTFHNGLQHLLAHFVQDFMGIMKQYGLSAPQITALMYIFHAGQCPVADLAALADASPAAASQLAERLVQQGLVDRLEHPTDRRTKLLTLSPKGLQLIHTSLPTNHYLGRLMGSLSSEERQTLHAALAILAKAAREAQISENTKDEEHA